MPSGAAMMAIRRTDCAPARLTVATAAAVEFPVGQHRVEQDDVALGDVRGKLHVVLDRLERLLVR